MCMYVGSCIKYSYCVLDYTKISTTHCFTAVTRISKESIYMCTKFTQVMNILANAHHS